MFDYTIESLLVSDGTWAGFEDDWRRQCDEVGEAFDDYANDSVQVLENIAAGTAASVGGASNKTGVAAMRNTEDGRFYAACMLNRAMLPNDTGLTLRVRHLLVAPVLDYGAVDPTIYADVLIGTLAGIINLSESAFQANNVRFHLRSPADMEFFRAFGKALDGEKVFASVQMRGAWLYITKA